MNISRSHLLLVAGLALAHLAPAHTPAGAGFTHDHPLFSAVTARYVFDDGTTVEFKTIEDDIGTSDSNRYTITITQTGNRTVTYSLLTLGIQAVGHRVNILSATAAGGNVMFAENQTAPLKPVTGPVLLESVGKKSTLNPGRTEIDGEKISFLSFDAKTCVLEVRAQDRVLVGRTKWARPANPAEGHDNTPPPSDPR